MTQSIESKIVIDDAMVKRMVARYPVEMRRSLKRFMKAEGRRFIGDKRKHGKVRKLISNLVNIKGSPWAAQVVSQFKFKFQEDSGVGGRFTAGLIGSERRIHQALYNLVEGREYSSSKYMIIPMYRLYKESKKPMGLFHKWIRQKEMYFKMQPNGKIYYFDKINDSLLFVAQKRVKMPRMKDLNVEEMWLEGYRGVLKRYEKTVQRTIERLEKKS